MSGAIVDKAKQEFSKLDMTQISQEEMAKMNKIFKKVMAEQICNDADSAGGSLGLARKFTNTLKNQIHHDIEETAHIHQQYNRNLVNIDQGLGRAGKQIFSNSNFRKNHKRNKTVGR